jgi:hypothetical protein
MNMGMYMDTSMNMDMGIITEMYLDLAHVHVIAARIRVHVRPYSCLCEFLSCLFQLATFWTWTWT